MEKRIDNKNRERAESLDEKTLHSPLSTPNSQLSTLHVDDDRVVFVPEEEIRAIENIYNKMKQAKQEFLQSSGRFES